MTQEQEELDYSPRLREAMEEIKAVLEKYDIAASVVLHTAWVSEIDGNIAGRSEYLNALSPSYSCASLEQGGFRFKAKATELPGGAAEREIKIAATANMLLHLMDVTGKSFMTYSEISRQLEKVTGPFTHK